MKIRTKIVCLMVLLVTITAATFSVLLYRTEKSVLLDAIDTKLLSAAVFASAMLDGYHDRIDDKNSVSKKEYLHIVDKYNKLCKKLGLQYIWSLMAIDEKIIFTSGTAASKDVKKGDYANFFEIHTNPKAYKEAFDSMEIIYSTFHDKWGEGRMVLVPSLDNRGRRHLFASSMGVEQVGLAVQKTLVKSFTVILAVLFLGILLSYVLANSLSKPIIKLRDVAEKIAKGELDQEICLKNATELESLSKSITSMNKAIKEKIEILNSEVEKRKAAEKTAVIKNEELKHKIIEKNDAEKALKDNEVLLSSVIKTIPDLIWLKDLEGKYLACNSRFEDFFGAKEKDIVGKTDYDFVDEELANFFRKHDKEAVAKGFPSKNEEKIVFADDGHAEILETIKTPMFNSEGKLVGVLGIGRDITARKESEQSLRVSEDKFQKAFKSSPLLMTISAVDDGRYIDVNDTFLRIAGFDKDEVLGKTSVELGFLKKRDREVLARKLRTDGYVHDLELELSRSDGSRLLCLYYGEIIEVDGEKRLLSIASDITKRKTFEKALEESERKWRNILVRTPQIGISLDPQAKIVFANEHFLELCGWKKSEVIDRDWFDTFIPDSVREEVRRVFDTVMKQKDALGFTTYENDIITKDGELRHIAWANVVTKDAEGYVKDVTCLGVDLTERRKSENDLRQREKKYRSLFEQSNDGIILHDLHGNIIDTNSRIRKMLGYEKEELEVISIPQLHPKSEHGKSMQAFESTQKQGYATFETKFLKKDGSTIAVDISSRIVDGEDGVVQGIVRDITHRKKAEAEREELRKQLLQAQKMQAIGTLAGGVAHDFNNILTPIMIQTELAKLAISDEHPAQAGLEEVLQSGRRAKDLVKQILTFSRVSDQNLMPLDIIPVIKESLKLLRSSIPTTIDIRQDLRIDTAVVLGDPTQIHQILMNLCTNSAQAMKEKGGILNVTLTSEYIDKATYEEQLLKPGRYVKLLVSDTGTGMDNSTMERAFEPFFTTKECGEGTGMGLSVVHGIVKSYGGTIAVESILDKCTNVTILLPETALKDKSKSEKLSALPTGHENVLLVDDEKPMVDAVRNMLEHLGYKVSARTSSVEALEAFRVQPDKFDLIITDMTMPNMTGRELAAEAMRLQPNIPVILCTGFSEQISEGTARAMGIREFVMKPIAMEEMAITIRNVLDA